MQEIAKRSNLYAYSGSSFIKKYGYIGVSIAILLIFMTINQKAKRVHPPINYIFYQPLLKDKMEWEATFKKLNQAHIKNIILQWSKFGVVDFIKEDKWLNDILYSAQQHNIKVIVGLYGDDRYFKILEHKDTNIEQYLAQLYIQNIKQAKKVYAIAKNYSSFHGYYLYDEIDDTNFIAPKRENALKAYLQKIAITIAKISNHPLYISGYFSNHISPKAYATMFSNITKENYTLLLQSGIGAKLVNKQTSSLYMQTFTKTFKGHFIPIIEGFRFKNSKIQATTIETLKEEITLIKEATNNPKLTLFSLRYFLDEELFNSYLLEYCYFN